MKEALSSIRALKIEAHFDMLIYVAFPDNPIQEVSFLLTFIKNWEQ